MSPDVKQLPLNSGGTLGYDSHTTSDPASQSSTTRPIDSLSSTPRVSEKPGRVQAALTPPAPEYGEHPLVSLVAGTSLEVLNPTATSHCAIIWSVRQEPLSPSAPAELRVPLNSCNNLVQHLYFGFNLHDSRFNVLSYCIYINPGGIYYLAFDISFHI